MSHNKFDISVVGGGHAGIEAALAAARLGACTALVTHDPAEVGRMPCNPAIGGLGKGHLVREIDVLGGEMGVAIDETGIQFRILNRRKGPAVQSPRAQADKHRYQERMATVVRDTDNLTVIAGDVAGLLSAPLDSPQTPRRGLITGVRLADGREIAGARVILCTGTFLKGLMHIGDERTIGGREGAASAEGLSADLVAAGFELRRLKTGTPPRLSRASIDVSRLQVQPGDDPPEPFSFRTDEFAPEQIDCYLAYTNARTHALIRAAQHRSPLFTGAIAGRGPRYCPSIEDKVVRFADKERHLLFLEPEGPDTDEVYVNGLSTSLPVDVQLQAVQSIPGLERARLVRYGYAVEYDSVPSWQIRRSFESKPLSGLYLAGQVLGTSGYEEAAAQGLVAGLNAVRSLAGGAPLELRRDTSYLGVLVDDLVTKDIDEPYRMFTSRAEHRLHLRCDNAEERLTDLALELDLLSAVDQDILRARRECAARLDRLLAETPVRDPDKGGRQTARAWLKHPGHGLDDLRARDLAGPEFDAQLDGIVAEFRTAGGGRRQAAAVLRQIENSVHYEGYISKQERLLRHQSHLDELELPDSLDYTDIIALSFEAREKLQRVRPATLGEASRIDGVRAGDLAVLAVAVKRWRERQGRPA